MCVSKCRVPNCDGSHGRVTNRTHHTLTTLREKILTDEVAVPYLGSHVTVHMGANTKRKATPLSSHWAVSFFQVDFREVALSSDHSCAERDVQCTDLRIVATLKQRKERRENTFLTFVSTKLPRKSK